MASTSSTSRSPATWIRSHLKWVAERVRDEMTAIPEITQADVVSAPPYEISIVVSENDLRRHGLTFDEAAEAVRRLSLDLPGGSVRTAGGRDRALSAPACASPRRVLRPGAGFGSRSSSRAGRRASSTMKGRSCVGGGACTSRRVRRARVRR